MNKHKKILRLARFGGQNVPPGVFRQAALDDMACIQVQRPELCPGVIASLPLLTVCRGRALGTVLRAGFAAHIGRLADRQDVFIFFKPGTDLSL